MGQSSSLLYWFETHPAFTQFIGILLGALFALLAAVVAYHSVTKQIVAARDAETRTKRREIVAIYTAFSADLDALRNSLTGARDALVGDDENDDLTFFKNTFLASRNIIWENCASRIGLLDPNHAANIIETYRFIDVIAARAKDLDFDEEEHRKDLAVFISATIQQIGIVLDGLPVRPSEPKDAS